MNAWKYALVSIALVASLTALLTWSTGPGKTGNAGLFLYCAAGIMPAVEDIVRSYRDEFGIEVELQPGGSGTLLNNLQVARHGDLYLAADRSYLDIARERDLVAETIPVARLSPVIAVPKGNPKGIRAPEDLLAQSVRVALANPDAASVGQVTREMFTATGLWGRLQAHVERNGVFKPTVNDLANDVKIGTADAAVVWDATAAQYPELESVPIPGADAFIQEITVGVLKFSEHPTAALRFARYLTARDRGLPAFTAAGYAPVDGDTWAETPEIVYYAGGVNRVAIEDTLKAFEQREGVRILTVYNGCGILVGQIKLGDQPDVYHTCDATFMQGVEEKFGPPIPISKTAIVIIVPRQNPKAIHALADLAQPGLQVGVANEQQSTLGALTARMLRDQGLYEPVTRNVVATTPTADLLVAQLTAGGLDAAVVYAANTTNVRDRVEVIDIPLPGATATQTYAVARNSTHRQLMLRFLEALRTAESESRFAHAGFEYLAGKPPAE